MTQVHGNYSPEQPRPKFKGGLYGLGALMIAAIAFTICLVMWTVVRKEISADKIMVLINKSGDIPSAAVSEKFQDQYILYPALVEAIAAETQETPEEIRYGYKGIQYEVQPAGRYFPNPISYEPVIMDATYIDQNKFGVLIRKYGEPLPFPKTVATEPYERGPVADILLPARYNINLLAYDVQLFDAIQIPEGHVGVVTLLSGDEPRSKNTYTVSPGEKGVQKETLPPGLYYENPYLKQIEIVDVRSHKYDMLNEDAIHFPSSDSFTITIEGTIEWALRPDSVAEVTVAYGDEVDILNKVILPNARSISRIQGSKLEAREFISGATRTAFQDRLLNELMRECWAQGIEIRAALVRDIQPPSEIASLISRREQADQEIERSTNEMEEAKAQAKLVEQQELQEQNSAIGDARRQVVTLTQQANERKVVAVTKANRELEVAKLALQSAEKQAEALRSRGQAQANVVLFDYQARAEPLARSVNAFGDGTTYARHYFFQKIAPSIESILTSTEGPFSDVFRQLQGGAGRTGSQNAGGKQ
ncbi:MAG: SPFH domain-containing protein [Planctomycetota bacterium]|jgi:regulator of protease activity HflC (stomatin/prohibitin superfamily)